MFLHLVNSVIQKSIISHDRWFFLWVLWNTFWSKQEFFIQSTIGILGWIDTPLPHFLYYGFAVLLGIVLIKTSERIKKPLPLGMVLFLTGLFLGTIFCFMYFFYIHGTPVASPAIDSLQGRYVLPIVPFILLILTEWIRICIRHKKITVVVFGIIFIMSLGQTLFMRYYDYSQVFDNAEALQSVEQELQSNREFPTVLVNNPQSYTYEVRFPNYKIGGFQLLLSVDEKNPVTVPYLFELKDASCSKRIRSGYLDQTELHRKHIYTQYVPITPLPERNVCLVLSPVFAESGMQFLPLVRDGGKPIINFLYIKK